GVQLVGDAIRYVPGRIVRHYLDLSGTFDAYLAKFSSKTRSTLKKKVRRFAERSGGTIDWREYRTAAEARQFHQLARVVAEKTYQEHLLDAALPADDAFVRGLEAEFAAGGADAHGDCRARSAAGARQATSLASARAPRRRRRLSPPCARAPTRAPPRPRREIVRARCARCDCAACGARATRRRCRRARC